MKRIALLHFAYPPSIGGVELLMREHAYLLDEFGYEVTIVTGSGHEDNPNIKVKEISELQSILSFDPKLQQKIFAGNLDEDFDQLVDLLSKKLDQTLQSEEIIIIHNMSTVSRNLAFIQALKSYTFKHPEKKFIMYTHDHMYIGEEAVKNIDSVAHSLLERELLTEALPNSQYVAISETFKKLLIQTMKIPRDSIHVIPNGVNIKNFLEIEDSVWDFIKKFNLLDLFPIILAPVNILQRKNLLYEIEIVAEMKKIFPHIRFIITGQISSHRSTQNYYQKLVKRISELQLKDEVIFMGNNLTDSLKVEEIHDLYSISDAVFYFSKSENFGLPLLEAALNKTPIFTSDIEVFHETLDSYGHYFDITLPPSVIAEKLTTLIHQNKPMYLHHRIRSEYSLRKILKKHLVPLL
ncbi:MAG TPA: glycosyltransferase family 4 protein [Candidatus Woesebacteria bacterium]|nr:glycosyltransferase family 4 protein [Candidatus Woesebacteria bacterium]